LRSEGLAVGLEKMQELMEFNHAFLNFCFYVDSLRKNQTTVLRVLF